MLMLITVLLSLILLVTMKIAAIAIGGVFRLVTNWAVIVFAIAGTILILSNLGELRSFINPPTEFETIFDQYTTDNGSSDNG